MRGTTPRDSAYLRTRAGLVLISVFATSAAEREAERSELQTSTAPLQLQALEGEGAAAQSLLGGSFDCGKIGFFKTTKTASSTTGATLYRAGVMLGSRFHEKTAKSHVFNKMYLGYARLPANLTLNHVRGCAFRDTVESYRRALQANPTLLTIVRHPVKRFVSDFYYGPVSRRKLRPSEIAKYDNFNHMAKEVCGAETAEEMQECLSSEVFAQAVFLVSERLAEGMAALHLQCGWPLRWLVSLPSNCATCGQPLLRFDCKEVPPREPISEATAAELEAKNDLDRALYDAAWKKWEDVEARGGQQLTKVAAEIRRQQAVLTDHCHGLLAKVPIPRIWSEHPGCLWLSLEDVEYEKTITDTGFVNMQAKIMLLPNHSLGYGAGPRRHASCRIHSNITVQEMVDDYNKMYDQLIGNGTRQL